MLATFLDASDAKLRLRCPCCGATLAVSPTVGHRQCISCGARFPLIGGIPVFLNPARSLFRAEDFAMRATTTFKAAGTRAERIGRMLPSPSRDVGRKKNYARMAEALKSRPFDSRRVLVIGSGDGSASYGAVADVEGVQILETDVSLAGSATIVCDASDLPLESAQFDLVICQAVLEHVLEPQRCVDEMHRVLKTDGWVYVTTPFMQQVHMGEFDFTRFTRSGHRWLLRHFDEVDSGVATGPASVLVWSIEYFLLSWTGTVWLRRTIKAIVRLLFGWLTWFDYVLAARSAALDGAGGFFFLGRKSTSVLPVRAILGYYRGADAVK